ncbi:bifunctional diaminohydroxyphosphoribosylaminopyrimidine deaminase/5-amino-6-(5-phosphoribosylamino)uracil reductase RibD [Sporosarcina sp. Te-1]|uniref:bifunctional diaminohydroxyphosphoribosylaminopyrimidine deaminase/5-amino-6-(5-phosphoribosylamino)uracil reductase RibD n=1 Tax=Sporosarcina sp. Te-1 TaxID=2818390 RepID=UPI001A9E385E|nr:bifunctional diaminohydroxyphosphoribosylaminopyrimidine deaminase/5-amino-6-(5-phosphoribosylamino)uracil reductase RibD [Sporosarcina sp. Te-1]QTD42043.1 bifunctional diaminohydroxyphosphoribosylaminopyrimidine deaminase/5-amino-6-(5-phosphoribosylamino)uracil reductase RibD [Sporosarcina sp. Te-1]
MEHDDYMKLAVQLARTATGQTSPNPIVGAVCVADGQVVGTGFHVKAGTPHAEVHALRMAGELAYGADLYVTLEPCAHTGKTPPCTEAIIASGIRRVFIASIDPNPAVSGKGIGLLRNAGIEVTMIPSKEADFSNRAFFHYIQNQKPYVTLKAAVTLDGRLATQHGDSKWITSEQARLDVHHLRHTHDAILVGVQTILQDNPFLTTRLPHGGKNPIRIILDRRLRTPKTAHVITDNAVQTILFTLDSAKNIDAFREFPLVHVETIPEHADFLEEVLTRLAKMSVMTVLVEGGSQVHSSFIDRELAQELYLYMAPKLVGNGPSLFENKGRSYISESELLQILSVKQIGHDIRLHASFSKEVSAPCLLGS